MRQGLPRRVQDDVTEEEKELKPPRHASPQHGGLQAQGTRGVGHARAPAAPSQGCTCRGGRRRTKPKRPDPAVPRASKNPQRPPFFRTVAGANAARRTNLTHEDAWRERSARRRASFIDEQAAIRSHRQSPRLLAGANAILKKSDRCRQPLGSIPATPTNRKLLLNEVVKEDTAGCWRRFLKSCCPLPGGRRRPGRVSVAS